MQMQSMSGLSCLVTLFTNMYLTSCSMMRDSAHFPPVPRPARCMDLQMDELNSFCSRSFPLHGEYCAKNIMLKFICKFSIVKVCLDIYFVMYICETYGFRTSFSQPRISALCSQSVPSCSKVGSNLLPNKCPPGTDIAIIPWGL